MVSAVPRIPTGFACVLIQPRNKAGKLEEEELIPLGKAECCVKRLSLIVPSNLHVLFFM